jgi:MFS family permease
MAGTASVPILVPPAAVTLGRARTLRLLAACRGGIAGCAHFMGVLATYRRLLANGPLARLLAGEFVSSIGDWLYLVALLVVVYQRENSAALLGVIGAARVLPYVVLSVPAGIVADRFDRKTVLLVTDIARGVCMLLLAWLVATEASLVAIVVVTILATSLATFFGPTIGAYLPSLTRDESELGPANSAWASLDNFAFVIGPAIAGVLITVGGLTLAFLLNAVTFGIIAVVLWGLPSGNSATPPDDEPDATREPVASFGSQLRRLRRPLSGMTLINAVDGFVFGGLGILTVVIAVDVLGQGEATTGYLNAAIGVGGVLGAVGSGILVLRRKLAPPLLSGGIVLGIGMIVLGQVGSLAPALIAVAIAAAGSLLVDVVSTTLFQRTVPDAIRGRTLGVLNTIAIAFYAAGSLLLPVLAGVYGIVPTLAAAGALMIVATLVGVLLIGPASIQVPALSDDQARLLRVPAFAGLQPGRLESAAQRAVVRQVAAGETVIRQGEVADRFYVILDGTFAVTQQDGARERELRRMTTDEVFGEIGLLSGVSRTATVTAIDDGRLLALDGSEFVDLVASGAGVSSRLLGLHRGGADGGAEMSASTTSMAMET